MAWHGMPMAAPECEGRGKGSTAVWWVEQGESDVVVGLTRRPRH